MAPGMSRRDLVRLALASGAAWAAPVLWSCAQVDPRRDRVFPQGIGSADPRADRVVLWTRVEPSEASADVALELATDPQFKRVVERRELRAQEAADHTVRAAVTGLSAATDYYYRFVAGDVTSQLGRTRTAAAPDSEAHARFAVASCQDYVGRHFHSWRLLAERDEPLDFILFLGDYFYETTLTKGARVPTEARHFELPDGLALGPNGDEGRAAVTLADFRALYRTVRGDPDLKLVHSLFPFIAVWDDHEFGNDCWGDHLNHFDGAQGDERNTAAREAATRAFFEYVPVEPELQAAAFPDDLKLYRSFRFGRHVELFITDQRYYRDDHLIDEGPKDPEVGKLGENSLLGSRTWVRKEPFDAREAAAPPTMLGKPQLEWLVSSVRASDATWKLIGSQTMLAQLVVDLSNENISDLLKRKFYFKLDQWDGFRTERRDLLERLAGTQNVVFLSGDLHGFFASELKPDFDAPGPATAVEYLVTGISSLSLKEQLQIAVETEPVLESLGLKPIVRRADDVIRASNPHFAYSATAAYGLGTFEVRGAEELLATFHHLTDVLSPKSDEKFSPVSFRTPGGVSAIERR